MTRAGTVALRGGAAAPRPHVHPGAVRTIPSALRKLPLFSCTRRPPLPCVVVTVRPLYQGHEYSGTEPSAHDKHRDVRATSCQDRAAI